MAEPYLEVLDMRTDADGFFIAYFSCNVCGQNVDNAPCPDHAPLNVPGLQLIECDAIPRHPYAWLVCSEAHPPQCFWCRALTLQADIDEFRACKHWPWRRSHITYRIYSWMYALGIISSHLISWGGPDHRGCVDGAHWRGKRPYLLGWPRWKWNCLLRERHWPGRFVGLESCSKCLPCPDCGSSTSCFNGWCDNQAAKVVPQ
jgi:hypothetical protein